MIPLNLERHVPHVIDISNQFDQRPEDIGVFMYDDGGVFRAFAASTVSVESSVVTALDSKGGVVCVIPTDTTWRLVSKDCINMVTMLEIKERDLKDAIEEYRLQKEWREKYNTEAIEEEWLLYQDARSKRKQDLGLALGYGDPRLPMPGQHL